MPTKDELEKKPLTELAVLCARVANKSAEYTQEYANEAAVLKKEWMSLQTPPESNLKQQSAKEAQLATLKKRMVVFLVRTL